MPWEYTDFRNWIGTWWFLVIIVDWLIWNPCLFLHPETWKPWPSLQDSVFWLLLPPQKNGKTKKQNSVEPQGKTSKNPTHPGGLPKVLPIFFQQKSTAFFFRGLSNACWLKKCSGEDFFGSGDAKRRAVANEAQNEQNFLPLFNGHVFFPCFVLNCDWGWVKKSLVKCWVSFYWILNFSIPVNIPGKPSALFFMAIVAGFRGKVA